MAGGGGIEFALAGNSTEVVNAIDRYTRAIDKATSKTEHHARVTKRATSDTSSGFQLNAQHAARFVQSLAAGIGVSGALGKAIAVVREEFRRTIELAEKSRSSQTGFAGALRNLQVNFSEDKSLDQAGLLKRIASISRLTGTGQNEVASALSTALSAKGDISNAVAVNAVEQAFRLLPGDVDAAQQLSGRALDIAKNENRTDVSSILGQLVQAQGAARVTNIGQLGSTAIPAAISTISAGGTSEEGLELFSALTNIAGDEEGRQTSTALISLVEQLKGFDGGERFAGAKNTSERLAVLQNSPELAERFLESASFEKKLLNPIQKIVRGEASAVGQLQAARAAITGGGAASAKAFEDKVKFLDETSGEALARAERLSKINQEGRFLSSGGEATTATVRKIVADTLAASRFQRNEMGLDVDSIRRQAFDKGVADGVSPFRVGLGVLVDELETLSGEAQPELRKSLGGDPKKRSQTLDEGVAYGSREEIQLVRRQIEVLTDLRDEVRKQGGNRGANAPKAKPAANLGN